MGLLVPSVTFDSATGPVTLSSAYIAIGHYDVNVRNYKPELINDAPFLSSNDDPVVQTQVMGILPGMSILVNYGIWESKDARLNKDFPATIRTIQASYDPASADIYFTAYGLVKGVFPDAQDDLVAEASQIAPP